MLKSGPLSEVMLLSSGVVSENGSADAGSVGGGGLKAVSDEQSVSSMRVRACEAP